MAERGIQVDNATLNRWVAKYAPLIAMEAHKRKQKTAVSWRMDEAYIEVIRREEIAISLTSQATVGWPGRKPLVTINAAEVNFLWVAGKPSSAPS